MKKRWIKYTLLFIGFSLISLPAIRDLLREGNFDFGKLQWILFFIGVFAILLGLVSTNLFRFFRISSYILFVLGICLILVNLVGEVIPLRDSAVYAYEADLGRDRLDTIELSSREVIQQSDQYEDESLEQYVYRLVDLIHRGTVHFWDDEEPSKLNQRIPFYENYLLFLVNSLMGNRGGYEFCNPYRAIERGVGLCSQRAKTVVGLLNRNGIESRIHVLEGHVVAEAKINNGWWVLDADYGVIIEMGVEELYDFRDVVKTTYMEAGYSHAAAEKLEEIYDQDGNYIEGNKGICQEEEQLYRNKWLWPLYMMIPGVLIGVVELLQGTRNLKKSEKI